MKNAKRRNHYIPRLLLKRFASRHDGQSDQYFVWQLSQKAPPVEISTRNAAVGNFFYGRAGDSIEDDFISIEGRLATALNALDAGATPEAHAEELRVCVWAQTVRTAALRAQFIETVEQGIAQMRDGFGSPANHDDILEGMWVAMEEKLHARIKTLPPAMQSRVIEYFSQPNLRSELKAKFSEQIGNGEMARLFSAFMEEMEKLGGVAAGIEDGHIRALRKLLREDEAPESFQPAYWKVLYSNGPEVVLGDSCVFGSSQASGVASLLKLGSDWQELYFPISKSSVLYAAKKSREPTLNVPEINHASASLSRSFVYASTNNATTLQLAIKIGTGSQGLTESEMEEVVEKALRSQGNSARIG